MDLAKLILALVGGGIVGSVLTYLIATKDLALRRRMQTTATFLQVAATAHGRRPDSDQGVGTGEQIAAMWLLADLGKRDKWLRRATVGLFDEQLIWLGKNSDLTHVRLKKAAERARGSLD